MSAPAPTPAPDPAPFLDPYSAAGVAAAARAPTSSLVGGQHTPMDDGGQLEEHFISINGRQIIPSLDDGQKATISVYDTSVLRGDGVFEVMKVIFVIEQQRTKVMDRSVLTVAHAPKVRCLEQHLERLQTSAGQVQCPLPPLKVLRRWIDDAISCENVNCNRYINDGGAAVRLMFTKGNTAQRIPPSTIISMFRLPKWPASFTLWPVEAPWHPAGVWDEWSIPIKWTSYGPNVVSTSKAKSKGYTDALLVSPHRLLFQVKNNNNNNGSDDDDVDVDVDCCCWKNSVPITQWHVLDGPNFAIGFIEYLPRDTERGTASTTEAILHLPSNEKLGLLPSITQKIVARLARTKLNLKVVRGIYKLEFLLSKADEIFVTSTTRGIKCVTSVGGGNNNLGNSNNNNNKKTFPSLQETRYTKQLVQLLEDYTGDEEELDDDDDDDDGGNGEDSNSGGDDGGDKRKDDGASNNERRGETKRSKT